MLFIDIAKSLKGVRPAHYSGLPMYNQTTEYQQWHNDVCAVAFCLSQQNLPKWDSIYFLSLCNA